MKQFPLPDLFNAAPAAKDSYVQMEHISQTV
jgi:hypothetical protein